MHILYAGCSVDGLCFVILLSSTVMHLSPAEIRQEGDLLNIFFCRHSSPGTWSDLTFHHHSDEKGLMKRQTSWDLIFRWVPSKWFILLLLNLPVSHRLRQAGSPEHFLPRSRQLTLQTWEKRDRLFVYELRMKMSMGCGCWNPGSRAQLQLCCFLGRSSKDLMCQIARSVPFGSPRPSNLYRLSSTLTVHRPPCPEQVLRLRKDFDLSQPQFPLRNLGTTINLLAGLL